MNRNILWLLVLSSSFAIYGTMQAQVGIGTNTPNASAQLEVNSTSKGFLPPRVALTGSADATTIASPATGLLVYNTNTAGTSPNNVMPGFYYYDGAKWQRIINQQPDATVEFDKATPTTAGVVFTPNTPASKDYVYVSTVDNSQWTYNGTTYVTYTPPASTPWMLSGGTNDAGSNKSSAIYRSGNVGIGTGTTAPTAGLEILTDGSALNALRVSSNQAFSSSPDVGIGFRFKFNTAGDYTSGAVISGIKENTTSGNQSGSLRFMTNNAGTIAERMRISSSGNVGIGTTSPTSILNLVGGGIKIHNGFANNTARPALTTSNIGNYEIRGVGSITGTSQQDGGDDGFLRLSAGGGTNPSTTQSSIDISGYSLNADMNSNIVMRTSGTERMRISSSGNLGLGTTSPTTALHIQNSNSIGSGDPASNTVPGIYLFNNNNASGTAHSILALRTGGAGGGKPYISLDAASQFGYSIGLDNPNNRLLINSTWNFDMTNSLNNIVTINEFGKNRVAVSAESAAASSDWPSGWGGGFTTYDISCLGIYYSTLTARSDVRLKNSIKDVDETAVNKYMKLRPVNYYWNKGKSSDTKLEYGLIAQEVEKIFPEMVFTASDSMQTKSVNYQALHALSLKVIQSQHAEIENLKKTQKDLEERLRKLERKLK